MTSSINKESAKGADAKDSRKAEKENYHDRDQDHPEGPLRPHRYRDGLRRGDRRVLPEEDRADREERRSSPQAQGEPGGRWLPRGRLQRSCQPRRAHDQQGARGWVWRLRSEDERRSPLPRQGGPRWAPRGREEERSCYLHRLGLNAHPRGGGLRSAPRVSLFFKESQWILATSSIASPIKTATRRLWSSLPTSLGRLAATRSATQWRSPHSWQSRATRTSRRSKRPPSPSRLRPALASLMMLSAR